jgi:hypothetical protein
MGGMARTSAVYRLNDIAAAYQDADVQPDSWLRENTDTLCLIMDGEIVGGIVFQSAALVDPLVLSQDAPFRPVLYEILMLHLQGLLLGRGTTEYVFGTPMAGLDDYRKFLERQGLAEPVGEGQIHFFRRRIEP